MNEDNILDVGKTILLYDLHVEQHMLPSNVNHAGKEQAATKIKADKEA